MPTREPPPFGAPMLPPDALAGRTAFVTGGASGVGLAMAAGFARCGADVALVGRNRERLEQAARTIEAIGTRCAIATCDVREPEQIAAAFDVVEASLATPTILANNAGSNFAALAGSMSANAWRAITRINLDGAYFCCAEFYRRCMAQGLAGAIINNSATYAMTGFPGDAHAAASKAAVSNLTQSLASEWAPDGVRVNSVVAGFYGGSLATELSAEVTTGRNAAVPPAGRTLRPQELGWIAAYLASDYAAYVTGLNLVIDGAEWLGHAAQPAEYVPVRDRASIW